MPLVEICLAVLFSLFVLATWVNGLWYATARLPARQPSTFHRQPSWCATARLPTAAPSAAPQVLEKNAPGITLLVCARNEAHNLRRHLPLLLGQICPTPYEVLVVDDASTDDTPAVLVALQKQYAHLRTLRIETKIFSGKKHALTQGIASAKHDLILLTDADCQPLSAQWLHLMTAPLCHDPATEVVLGYAPCGNSPNAPPAAWLDRWIRFETAHTAWTYFAFARMGQPYMGVGRNLALRRGAFERVGGFAAHQHLASGDDDLLVSAIAERGNTAICLDNQAFVFSEGKKTWHGWYAQKRRHLSAGARYQPLHRLLLGALALSHSGHYAALLVLTFTDWAGWAWGCWAVRMAVLYVSWLRASKVLRASRQLVFLPLLDAMMAVYFGVFGLILTFDHKRPVKW